MSFLTGSDNYSRWLASASPQLWPASPDPTQHPLSDCSALPPPPGSWTLSNDFQGPFGPSSESPAGSHETSGSIYVCTSQVPISLIFAPDLNLVWYLQSIQYLPQDLSHQLSQEQISHFLTLGSPVAFMTLYQHGILSVSPIDEFHAFLCPHCLIFIKSSISVSLSLSTSGHFTVLSNHYRHKSCTTHHACNQRTLSQGLLKQLDSTSNSPISTPPDSSLSLPPLPSESLTLITVAR